MRKVIIMRGLPGAGKSRWTHRFSIENKTSVCVVSADTYHYVPQLPNADGTLVPPKYEYKAENGHKAHLHCFVDFMQALKEGWEIIIVDNTNISAWEIAPYYRLAEVHGIEVEIILMNCPTLLSIGRNIHNVPEETIKKMAYRLENESLPPWWKQTEIRT